MSENNFKEGDIVQSINKDCWAYEAVGNVFKIYGDNIDVLITKSNRKKDVGRKITFQHCELVLVDRNTQAKNDRLQPMYAYTKIPRALTLLSALTMWGDSKHGIGPIKLDVDYKAKYQAHLTRLLSGEGKDRESNFDHRLAAAFNLLAEVEKELIKIDLEDFIMNTSKKDK